MAGVAHVCLEVDNIVSTVATLMALGATAQGELVDVESGPVRGCRAIYIRDPNGVIIELVQLPNEIK